MAEPNTAQPPALRPAAFLDRDGTIIVEREYLSDPDGVELIPGAVDGLLALRRAGYALVVVTNQSGIARGLFGFDEARAVQARVEELLAAEELRLDGFYLCPHHPDFDGLCDCRKPATGLYRRAAADLRLDLARSLFIGDRLSDVDPAATLGGTGILVRTGYGAAAAASLDDVAVTASRAGRPRPALLASLAELPRWLAAPPDGAGPAPRPFSP